MTDSEKLDEVFRSTLGLPQNLELRDIAYGKTQGWDSVAHMQLVAAIEEAFEIMMDTDDVIAMSNYGVARDILRGNYGVALDA